jgi:hypothetical protein
MIDSDMIRNSEKTVIYRRVINRLWDSQGRLSVNHQLVQVFVQFSPLQAYQTDKQEFLLAWRKFKKRR